VARQAERRGDGPEGDPQGARLTPGPDHPLPTRQTRADISADCDAARPERPTSSDVREAWSRRCR
jgi:hypothetical protein